MKSFIKAKLKKLDRQTNIDKHRGAAHELLQNIFSEQMFFYFLRHQKVKKILNMDILIFLDLYKEIRCLLHLITIPKNYHL